MDWKGCLLPLAFPLSVLVIGSWRLAVSDQPSATVSPGTVSPAPAAPLVSVPAPAYQQPPPGRFPTCQQDPALADALLAQGRRLGITLKMGPPELPGKDASYRAEHGRLGTITIRPRPMAPVTRCLLISHEFIHVLQHLHGDLRGVPPLGWSTAHPDAIPQEAEAYGHQQRAGYVLKLLQQTQRPQ